MHGLKDIFIITLGRLWKNIRRGNQAKISRYRQVRDKETQMIQVPLQFGKKKLLTLRQVSAILL